MAQATRATRVTPAVAKMTGTKTLSWQIILLSILLFFPGYLASKYLKLENEIAYGIGISVSLSILLGLLLGFVGLFHWFIFWPILLIITGVLWWKVRPELEWSYDWKQTTSLFLTVLFVFSTFYFERAEDRYPQHFDEFRDIAIAKTVIEQGRIVPLVSNTEFERTNHDGFYRNLQFGFHILLAELGISGFDLILDYRYFPAIFSLFVLSGIFVFIYTITGSVWATLPAMLLYSVMKTNIILLGPGLFVPIILAFGFILLFFNSFIKFYQGSKVHFFLTLLFSFMLVLIHPPSITFAIPVIALFVLAYPRLLKKNYKYLLIYQGIGLLGALAATMVFWDKGGIGFVLGNLVFDNRWAAIQDLRYSLLELAVIPIYVFALLGAIFCIRKKSYLPIAWMAGCLSLYFLYHELNWTLFSPYQRLLLYLTLSIFICAAIGMYATTKLISQRKYVLGFWVVLIIIPTVIYQDFLEDKPRLQYVQTLMDDDYYTAIIWADENLGYDNVVVIDHPKAWSFNAVSRNEVSERQLEYSFGGSNIMIFTCIEKADVTITKKNCPKKKVHQVNDVKIYVN